MHMRTTFLLPDTDGGGFDPSKNLVVSRNDMTIKHLQAEREERLVLEVDELPQEALLALRQCKDLHVRWATAQNYSPHPPFNARVSPGLHVYFTPQKSIDESTLLCHLLRKIFGLGVGCTLPVESFTAMPQLSDRFAPASAYNFHARVPSLSDFAMYLLNSVCPNHGEICLQRASELATAQYLDLDWNSTTRQLTLTTYRDQPVDDPTWDMTVSRSVASRVEIGVLGREKPIPAEPENLALGGLLTVVGTDTKPDSVLFTFPSRHHEAASAYSMSFIPPTGLHPTMRLSIDSSTPPAARSCRLHAYLTLPSVLFPDKYQLEAPLFLASKNLRAVRAIWGETDLEAPDWATSKWGSSMLVELAPSSSRESAVWHAEIPLHLRYLSPAEGGLAVADVPWPIVFWACRANAETNLSTNPFDRTRLGYDGMFGPSTIFYHLRPEPMTMLEEQLNVPVLDTARLARVEGSTAVIIFAGLVWVLWKLLVATQAPRSTHDKKQL